MLGKDAGPVLCLQLHCQPDIRNSECLGTCYTFGENQLETVHIRKHHNLKPQVVTESFVPRGHLKIAREFAWLPSMKPYVLRRSLNGILEIGILLN